MRGRNTMIRMTILQKKKIEEMKNYISPQDRSGPSDAYLGVIGKASDGSCRLYGRGVSNKKLKMVNADATSYVVPSDIVMSLKASLIGDIRKDMDLEITRLNEAHKHMEDEHLKKKAELENIERELEAERENMTEGILRKLLGKLPPEIAKQYLSYNWDFVYVEYVMVVGHRHCLAGLVLGYIWMQR
ncbi:hypothetical protein RND81_05G032600 [Saponaria officinalis]|uniref:Uncharacterized protein n=1 Tax=Saponaria officinalis TaxID=3572 RepID=A0AAW1KU12_SAPOF